MADTKKKKAPGAQGQHADHALAPGQRFEERYEIVARIGTGGFSHVYRARQTDIGRDVAIKLLLPESTRDPSGPLYDSRVVERFEREGRLLSRLRDPRTITMYDFGRSARGLLYMVFEFIDGTSLKEIIAQQAPLPPGRVVQILAQVLQSLQEAHAIGVLHRDIKPSNIMLYTHVGRSDQVKVLDFGIAKAVRGDDTGLTQVDLTTDGAVVGTPRYMSPEQLRGHDLTPATDLYSLGLVTYELLTGERAVKARGTVRVLSEQLNAASKRLPGDLAIPAVLRRTVDQLMEKDTARRQSSADEVLLQLRELIALEVQLMATPAGHKPSVPTVALLEDPTGDGFSIDHITATEKSLEVPTDVSEGPELQGDPTLRSADDLTLAPPEAAGEGADDLASQSTESPGAPTTPGPAKARWRWWLVALPAVALLLAMVTFFGGGEADQAPATTPGEANRAAPDDGPRAVILRTEPPGLLLRVNGISYGPAPARVEHVVGSTLTVEVLRESEVIHTITTDDPAPQLLLRVPEEGREAGEEGAAPLPEGDDPTAEAAETETEEVAAEDEKAPARRRNRTPKKKRTLMFEPMDE